MPLRRALRITALLVLVGLLLLALRAARPALLTAVRIEQLQLFLFPVFFAALWFGAGVLSKNLRRYLLLVAGIGFCTTLYQSVTSALSILSGSSEVILVSRLKGDADDGETRILRERISYFLKFADVAARPEQQTRTFSSDAEVREVLAARSQVDGLVWGSTRFLAISLPDRAPFEIRSFGSLGFSPLIERLEVVDGVPVFGLSYFPRESAAFFITKVLEGMSKRISSSDPHFDANYRAQYHALHIGAEVATLHYGAGHRAYALWRSGTDSLRRYLVGGAVEPGYLGCAETDLRAAQKLLRFNENPELGAAIQNNLGVLIAIRGDLEADGQALLRARKTFLHAKQSKLQLDHFRVSKRAVQSAKRNAALIAGEPLHHFKSRTDKVKKARKKKARVQPKKERKNRDPGAIKKPKKGHKKRRSNPGGATP